MGFRKEVREFMRSMELAFAEQNAALHAQNQIIDHLEGQTKDLMDRLMAKDFKELQIFATPEEVEQGAEVALDLTDDELAGEIVDVDE